MRYFRQYWEAHDEYQVHSDEAKREYHRLFQSIQTRNVLFTSDEVKEAIKWRKF